MVEPVWFWQRIVSPHMAGLAAALAERGREVTYVAEREMSEDRARLGWRSPSLGKATLAFAPDETTVEKLVGQAPRDSIHICQGLRGNGWVGCAQTLLHSHRIRQWVVMEMIDDAGWRGQLRRLRYRALIARRKEGIDGVLAIGHATPNWLVDRGMPEDRVFPFAYFLQELDQTGRLGQEAAGNTFTFLYCGQFIVRKRVNLLLSAFHRLRQSADVALKLVGDGPLAQSLREMPGAAEAQWLGRRPLQEIPAIMAGADCLVLPSRYDGWGAVVSEALMAGTPVICSDACGAAGVVGASGTGTVFPADDPDALATAMEVAVARGRPAQAERTKLGKWARCLGAVAGARYLDYILAASRSGGEELLPPWECQAQTSEMGETDLRHV